jgi:hypothetical protein
MLLSIKSHVLIFDLEHLEVTKIYKEHKFKVSSLCFAKSELMVISGSVDGNI